LPALWPLLLGEPLDDYLQRAPSHVDAVLRTGTNGGEELFRRVPLHHEAPRSRSHATQDRRYVGATRKHDDLVDKTLEKTLAVTHQIRCISIAQQRHPNGPPARGWAQPLFSHRLSL